MQIVIQSRGFYLTAGLREHVQRRVNFALNWAKYHVGKVYVRLSDINGPHGGEDKRCHIQIAVPGISDVVIKDTEVDLYAAIDRASERAGRSLARRLGRHREYRHDGPRSVNASAVDQQSLSAPSELSDL